MIARIPFVVAGLAMVGLTPLCQADMAEVSRITIEVTRKGELSVNLARVPDEAYEAAEGKSVAIFGMPDAEAVDDDGFCVVTQRFDSPESARVFGEGLSIVDGALVANTSLTSDAIGSRVTLMHPRNFGLPFTAIIDVIRHGSIAKTSPSQGGRSLNFNLFGRDADRRFHLYVTLQPKDTRYGDGIMAASWAEDGGPLKEVAKSAIKEGSSRLRINKPEFPKDTNFGFVLVVRGDNARFKRARFAGLLRPTFGMEVEGTAGTVAVKTVASAGPAELAGIEVGDRIISVAGERVRDVPTALDLLSKTPLFGTVEVVVRRGENDVAMKLSAL